jgi:uncharacterized protein YecT (DUF1311 family)
LLAREESSIYDPSQLVLIRPIAILLSFSFFFSPCVRAQKPKPIDEAEIRKWLVKDKEGDCEERQIYFRKFEHFDFKGDGNQEAIVIASTCYAGTGGADIHSVFSRDSSGELVDLKIPDADPDTYDNLFGNRNYDLSAEDGVLVATFTDDDDRETPLIIRYRWNGKEFAIASVKKTGVFRTSYDCSKAQKEDQRAICHVDSLADLDLDLSALYESLLAKLSGSERDALRDEQQEWLSQREKKCVIYKRWVSCLTGYYQHRIDELKKRNAVSPKSIHPVVGI